MQDNNTKDNNTNNERNLSEVFEELKKTRDSSVQNQNTKSKKSDLSNIQKPRKKTKNIKIEEVKKLKQKVPKQKIPKQKTPKQKVLKQKTPKQKILKQKMPKMKKVKNHAFSGALRYRFDTLRSDKQKFRQFIILSIVYLVIIIALVIFIVSYISNKNKYVNPYGDFNTYEKNTNPFNISQILIDNTNTTKTKEKTYRDKEIPYSTKYVENNSLPKDEKVVKQPGVMGLERVNIIRTYEGEDLIDESTSSIDILSAPVEEIVEVGTSDFLTNYNVHLGDVMYVISTVSLMDAINNGTEICKITRYMDVILLEVAGDWCKVSFDGQEGYVPASSLTSQSTTPGIVSQNKVQRIMSKLNFNMALNVKSGLTLDDYKRILSNESRDVNKVIQDNAEAFYNAEQKYNVNGILLVAMAIHESGWGTSAISLDKKNLFGYGAYDNDAYNSAYTFNTYAEGIDLVAKVLAKAYLNPAGMTMADGDTTTGRYYSSPTLTGINTRYSTDPNWCTKVFSYMTYFYDKL